MNYKTILKNVFSNIRKNRMAALLFFASFFSLWSFQVQAQTLKTGSQVVILDACSDAKEFSVRIAKGNTECADGTLKIEIPEGFQLVLGSIQVDGVDALVNDETVDGGVVKLPLITAGPITEELRITFKVKALCEVIGMPAEDNVIKYTFSGCGNTTPQTGTSETINIRYAVLRVSVSPISIFGLIGDEIERTVTILNQGNGEIPVIELDRVLGNGLSHISYDFASGSDWTVGGIDVNNLVFSGSTLKSGQTITFKETVKIDECALSPTEYEVYYGCSVKCERSSVNGSTKHIINIKEANAPNLEVKADAPKAACFNGYVPQTWTIKNTGGTATDEIEFEIGTNDELGHIDPNTIKVDDVSVSVIGSPSNEPKSVKIKIPALAPGSSIVLTFDQYLSAPIGDAANCASAPTSFTNNNNYFGASYRFDGACAPMQINGEVTKEVTYSFEGKHIGEIDILNGEKFEADFLFKGFKIPSARLVAGDSFSVIITLSADLIIRESSDIQLTLGGMPVIAVPTGSGSEYKITFVYGTGVWALGTDLNLTTARLRFPLELDCPMTGDLWYRIGGELNKKDETGTACSSIVFNCKQTELKGNCEPGTCVNGLQNGTASLARAVLGYKVDEAGVPNLSLKANPGDVQIRTFIAGDILEISQIARVQIESGQTFTTVKMIVEKDNNTNTELVENSGKIIITRDNIRYEFRQLSVQENTSSYIFEFNALGYNAINEEFLNLDDVILSLQIKAISAADELSKFPTNSYLVRGDEMLKCGVDHTATGFYVPTEFKFNTAKADFVSCEENTNIATFTAILFGLDRQDAIFTKEFRKLFKATKATLTIPEQLHLTEVKVVVKNQSWLGSNNFKIVSNLDVTNGEYDLDLETILDDITEGASLDEGFVLEITPTVSLLGCEPTSNLSEVKVGVKMEGIIYDGAGIESSFSETKDLIYNTGIGTLRMELSNEETFGTFSPSGTHVSWVVKVGSSGARNFNSVWIAKESGLLEIESIVPVSDFTGSNPEAALNTDTNNLYQLGDFRSGSSKYYLITSKVIDCMVEELVLVSGYNCASNSYPADSNSGCGLAKITLTHDDLKDILQSTIVDASNQNSDQNFCEDLWYSIEIHNGGDTQAKDIKVRIPLNTAPGLKFREFKYSNVFNATDLDPIIDFENGSVYDETNNVLTLVLPNTIKLNKLDRTQVIVIFDIDGCDFRSGSKLMFHGIGNNVCDAEITNLVPAPSKRIIIEGGSHSFPELSTIKHEVALNPVLSEGDILRADYNFELKNVGDIDNNDAITSEYYFSVKLPDGWTIVGNPQDYISPAGKVKYLGIDQIDDRGYFYQVIADIEVGEGIKLVDVPLKYTESDEVFLDCEYDFGEIKTTVFQYIDVSDCSTPNCGGIDQVLLEDIIPMILPVDSFLELDPVQTRTICNPLADGSTPTLEDITFENGYYLSWYENELEAIADNPANRLPLTTPLQNNRTYYVINRFIADGICKSNIAAVKVLLNNETLTGVTELICSIDQQTYTIVVKLSGEAPYSVSGTGTPGSFDENIWTSEPIAKGTDYELIFTDAQNCTPLVIQGEAPLCCTLQIECPIDITVSCERGYNPEITGIPTIITSCGITTYTYTDSSISDCTLGIRSFTRKFTVTDALGNVATCEQIISIEDNVAPVLNKEAQNITVSCETNTEEALNNWLKNHGGAQATDACGAITWTNDYDEDNFVDSCVGTKGSVEVVFTAKDVCGNEVKTTATFTIEDKTPPTITKVAEGLTLECNSIDYQQLLDAWLDNNGGATATDGCSNDLDLEWEHNFTVVTQGSCPGTGSALVTFTVTDPCGNKATTAATFTIVDTTAPIFTKKPESIIVECDGKGNLVEFNAWLANHGGAEAEDGCGPVFWETTHIEDTNTICGITGTVIVDFIVKDACGNWAMEQATFAIKDTVAPTIVEEAKPLVIECGVHVEDELNAWLSNFGGAIATDSCGDVTWAHDYTGNLTVCGAPIEVTFTVTDACNNKSTTKATVKVVDNVAPTLTKKAQSVTVECSANTEQALENWLANHAGAEAKDSCSIVTWTNDYVPANFVTTCGNAGSVTVIFTATDGCGNTITTTATFTIEDTTAPKFVGQLPVERMTVSCDVVPATPILVATDNCGEAVISFTEKKVGGLCANSYDLVRVWTATDSCGNATSFTQTITVEDTVAPVFTILPENLTVECDGEGNEADFNAWLTTFGNAVATDNCSAEDKLVWTTEIVNTSVLCGKTGNTVVKFTVTDECGNASSKQATFTIVDTTAPSIDMPAEALVLECGTNVDAQITTWLNNHGGAEASDACGSVTWSHNYTGLTAACGNTGNATVVFTATDSCGNTETSSATITVEDTLKPTLLKEAQGLTVQCGTTTQQALENWLANHAGAEATDSCSTVVWTNDYDDSKFPTACSATDTVTVIFTATDACGNAITTTATFAVEDNEAPKFVGQLPVERMTVSCDVIPATPILVATDNCGEAVISFTEKKVGGLCANSYDLVRVWTATDSCGNATSFTQTITVEDTVAPTFVEELPTNVTVSCSADVPTAVVLTAIDNCGTADVVMTEKRVDGSCSNNYVLKRTWVATDLCGNSISHTQIIRVEDKIAPEFVGDLPANITVSCLGDLPADTIVTATDNCGDVEVVLKETRVDGTCANSFVLTKTWTATDSCGNSVAHTQIITVDDKVAPVFVTVPQNLTVECDGQGNEADFNAWIANYADAVATDNCSTEDKLVWTTEIVNTSVLCGKTGNTVVKFTVTDECGNNVSKQAVFTVVDTAGPDFIAEAQDKTVACDGNGNANDLAAWLANHAGAKATDACSNGITWTNDFTGLDKACGSTGSATVTFRATDSCGNTSETTATFTIVDEEAPVFTTNLPQDLTLECSVEIPEAAVMNAVDACSTAEVVFTEERINGSCLGSYQLVRTWTATDSCGNAVSHVQTITIEDTTAPVFVDPLPVRELYMSCEDLKEAEELKAIDSCGTVDVTFTEETIAGECSNRYTLVRTWTATDSCGNATEFVQDIHVACKIEFTNAISANGDGVNDEFQLKGIECYPGNTVEIFNRWGKLVYSTTNYNSNGNVFKGYANTKHVVSGGEKLPTGTYFYVVKYDFSLGNGTTQSMDQSGYIHLESNK